MQNIGLLQNADDYALRIPISNDRNHSPNNLSDRSLLGGIEVEAVVVVVVGELDKRGDRVFMIQSLVERHKKQKCCPIQWKRTHYILIYQSTTTKILPLFLLSKQTTEFLNINSQTCCSLFVNKHSSLKNNKYIHQQTHTLTNIIPSHFFYHLVVGSSMFCFVLRNWLGLLILV